MNYWENIFKGNNGYYMDLDNPSRLEILKYISQQDSVLELGCGGGALCQLLPDKSKYTGLDYSETAIQLAQQRFPEAKFSVWDARNLSWIEENEYDVVVMRHFLENQEDWRKVLQEAFRIANKKVIVNLRRPLVDYPSKILENPDDTWVWDINYGEFNILSRQMSVNVSYGKVNEEEFVIIGKHLDNVIFDLDDWHDTNNGEDLLKGLKQRFPDLKVTLFCIPTKCNPHYINRLKAFNPWMQFAVHGWYHDTEHGTAQECNYWTRQEAEKWLDEAEKMGCFEKIFRAPGWNYNIETYKVLIERGYVICEHLGHDRWPELGGKRYTTGHLWEVHGHVQNVNMNGLEELATTKCNFGPNTKFHFITENILDNHLPNRYQ